MIISNIRIAMHSIRSTRVRSLLTTLGVVIGVASVVLAVNIGQGVKQQVTGQIDAAGGNLITVRSGRVVIRDDNGEIVRYSLNQALGASTLTDTDLETIKALGTTSLTAPLAEVGAIAKTIQGQELIDGHIIGTTAAAPTLFGKDLIFGNMFNDTDQQRTTVIGIGVAEELFGDPSPIGRIIKINDADYIIKGIFERFQVSPISIGTDFNRTVFIPYKSLSGVGYEDAKIKEILVRSKDVNKVDQTIDSIQIAVQENHGQEDFSVLRQSDLVFITDDIFGLITGLVAAVAAISLIVGGIGIMNIMLVSVAERTREIGIRKAIGASNMHIMAQFLTESIVLSLIGGFVGVLLAQIGGLVIRSLTTIQPVFDTRVVLITIAVSVLVGALFGVGPAWKAARKKTNRVSP